jgi:SOS response regulatory protein OraA/RecX
MRIEKLNSTPDMAGRYRVQFEDGSILRLYRQTVEDFGLYSGIDLSDNDMKRLQTAAGEMSAKMRAVRIVSASSVSKKDLEKRLIQKGEKPDQAKAAVAWMEDLSLLDDRKTAEQVVYRCISKGYGLTRAKQALYEKRIPKELWDEVLEDYPDQQDHILSFLESRLTAQSDDKEIRKAIDALMRKGHTYYHIRRALDQLSFDTDEFPEE